MEIDKYAEWIKGIYLMWCRKDAEVGNYFLTQERSKEVFDKIKMLLFWKRYTMPIARAIRWTEKMTIGSIALGLPMIIKSLVFCIFFQ